MPVSWARGPELFGYFRIALKQEDETRGVVLKNASDLRMIDWGTRHPNRSKR